MANLVKVYKGKDEMEVPSFDADYWTTSQGWSLSQPTQQPSQQPQQQVVQQTQPMQSAQQLPSQITDQHIAIPGAQYDTREKQQSAFSDIQPVGGTLYGIPKPIVPDVIPQQDLSSAMSSAEASRIEADAASKLGFTKDQLFGLQAAYERQLQGIANKEDINNINYAMSKGWQPSRVQEEGVKLPIDNVISQPEPTKSTVDQIFDMLFNMGELRRQAREEAALNQDLAGKSDAIAIASTLVNKLRTELENKQIYDIKEQDIARSKPILTSQIQGQLNEMSREQKLDAMIMQNNYNNALVELQIAQGNYDRAREIVRETADDAMEAATFQLEALMFRNQIEERDANRLMAQLEYERGLALEGYVHIKSPEELEMLSESDLFRDPVNGKIYLKPEPAVAQIININGRMKGIDSKGNIVKDFGGDADDGIQYPTKIGDNIWGWGDKLYTTEQLQQLIGNAVVAPSGSYGGQCGDYLHSIMDVGTRFGDLYEEKSRLINVSKNNYQPELGDILIFETNMPYGHVAAVTGIEGNKIQITESNLKNDEKVGERILDLNEMPDGFSGAYRGAKFKQVSVSDDSNISKDLIKKWDTEVEKELRKILDATDREDQYKKSFELIRSLFPRSKYPGVTDDIIREHLLGDLYDPYNKTGGGSISIIDDRRTQVGRIINPDAKIDFSDPNVGSLWDAAKKRLGL